MNIQPQNLMKAVEDLLDDYTKDVQKATADAVKEVADESVKELKHAGDFNGTAYRRSWKKKVEQGRVSTSAVVYNDKNYRLTHLLEFGHAKQNGGRTRAFPHIAPVNDSVPEKFEKAFRRAME